MAIDAGKDLSYLVMHAFAPSLTAASRYFHTTEDRLRMAANALLPSLTAGFIQRANVRDANGRSGLRDLCATITAPAIDASFAASLPNAFATPAVIERLAAFGISQARAILPTGPERMLPAVAERTGVSPLTLLPLCGLLTSTLLGVLKAHAQGRRDAVAALAPLLRATPDPKPRRWLVPALLLCCAALVACGIVWLFMHAGSPATTSAVSGHADRATSVSLVSDDHGKPMVRAQVDTTERKQELLQALTSTFGNEGYTADVSIDAAAAPASWWSKLPALLAMLHKPNVDVSIKGQAVQVAAGTGDELRGLREQIVGLLGDGYSWSELQVSEAIAMSAKALQEGLAALDPSKCTAADVVQVLNAHPINFDSGATALPERELEGMAAASKAVAGCAKGARLQIQGHTDSLGSTEVNLAVSKQRADAVRSFLVTHGVNADSLEAVGYGASRPVAENETPKGRYENRRIAFALLP